MNGPSLADAASPPAVLSLRLLALAYSGACYLIFLAVFLYTIGFVSNLAVPKSVDIGLQAAPLKAIPADLLLLGLFAIPHSIMARPGFKRWWTQLVSPPIERSTYVLVSSLMLALLFWQWRPLPGTAWQVEQPSAVAAMWGAFAAGWLIVLISTFLIDHFALFGLRQVHLYATGRLHVPQPFRTPALYRIVRHPIMLGFVIAFWATPIMTWGHLLFAAVTTAYIVAGIHLEERDLRSAFGATYEAYQQRVSMLFPWSGKARRIGPIRQP